MPRRREELFEMLGDNTWILAVNLVIWTGLFLYLMHLNNKVRELEKDR